MKARNIGLIISTIVQSPWVLSSVEWKEFVHILVFEGRLKMLAELLFASQDIYEVFKNSARFIVGHS